MDNRTEGREGEEYSSRSKLTMSVVERESSDSITVGISLIYSLELAHRGLSDSTSEVAHSKIPAMFTLSH
jgi:hypothetical protein